MQRRRSRIKLRHVTTRNWLTGLLVLTLATGCHGGEPTEEEERERDLLGFLGDFAVTASVKPDPTGSRRFGVTVEQVDDSTAANAMWMITIDSGNLVSPTEKCQWIDAQNARCFSATQFPLEEIEFSVDATGPVVVRVNVPTVRDIDGTTTTIDPNPANNTTTLTLPAFQFDTIPPTLSSNIDPAPNLAGWNRGPVNVSWQSEDPTPSSGTPSQPAPTVIASEGASQIVNARSCDPAGNCAVGTATVSIDSSPPMITVTGNAGSYLPTQTVTISCSTTDALSGVATQNCPTISAVAASFGPGPHSFAATAQDKAGNVATQQFTFMVAETGPLVSPTSCSVEFVSAKNNGDTFAAKIQVTNNGPALPRWHLTWTYRAGESVTGVTLNATTAQGTNALLFTNGPGVDLYGSGANATFRAGNRLQTPIWIKGTWNASSKKATPPNQFALNGKPCTVDVHGSSYDK